MKPEDNEQTQLLREILKWIKFTAMPQVKEVLTSALDNDQKRLSYQLSDGSRGIAEICKATGIDGLATISRFWKSWEKQNLGVRIPVRGGERFKRSFDLEDFGIEIPEVKGKEGNVSFKKMKEDDNKNKTSSNISAKKESIGDSDV
jgi:hypothetical protein